MAVDHRQLLALLDDLMKPISTVKISDRDEEQQQLLTINLVFSNACDRFLDVSSSMSLAISLDNTQPAHFRYVQIHLNLLNRLLALEEENLASHLPLFSIQDQSILSRSLSFVILLGLLLHFDEGIYHSIETFLQNSQTSIHLLKLKTNLTHHDRMSYLDQILNHLMKWIQHFNPNLYLTQRLCSTYLLELILGHLQLLHSPNLKYSSHQFSSEEYRENLMYLQTKFPTPFIQQIMLLNRLLSQTINSPPWLKHRCGELLSSVLVHPNKQGIRLIFQTIFESTAPNDRLYISLARILSTCPKQLPPEEYLRAIQSQLIELIHEKPSMPIICIAINDLFAKYPKLIEDEIFSILFQPLIASRKRLSNEICTEQQLESCFDDLSHLISIPPNSRIRSYVLETYHNELWNIQLALEQSLSPLKTRLFEILTRLFSSLENELFLSRFEQILFQFQFLSFKYLPDGFLMIDQDSENNFEIFCHSFTKILFTMENNDRLIITIFLHLLQLLVTKDDFHEPIIWTEKDKQVDLKQLKIMQVLKSILEYLTEHMNIFIQNIDDTIRAVQIILEKLTKTTEENIRTKTIDGDDDEDFSSDNEAFQIIFTIASLLITHYDQLSSNNKQILASLYPSFQWIAQNHSHQELRQLARELSIAFVTFGAVKDISSESKAGFLIEEINDQRDLREETFENALACLSDASLPIRAHGLILFRRLIERADQQTLAHISDPNMKLFQRFEEHLHAEDSYEYLAAVNVLHALASRYTEQILPILCHEYIDKTRKLDDRYKVGEILVKTCRILGDMSTKYSSLLINTFLNASKQTDDDIYRASALSNLGQLCTVLRYSLAKDLPEILIALKSYLSLFESADVRRAAILACELLCQALEQSTWLTILGKDLPSFYQLINHLYKNDKDDIVRLHAQIALEELNKMSRDYLQPPLILEKKIRILS